MTPSPVMPVACSWSAPTSVATGQALSVTSPLEVQSVVEVVSVPSELVALLQAVLEVEVEVEVAVEVEVEVSIDSEAEEEGSSQG